jgi:predicted aspartyl protease
MTIHAGIKLISGTDLALADAGYLLKSQVRTLTVSVIANSNVSMMLFPEWVKNQLDLHLQETRCTEILMNQWVQAEIYSYVQVEFENRRAISDVYVIPNQTEIIIGRCLMLAMDTMIDPQQERLIVNPESPHVARMLLM